MEPLIFFWDHYLYIPLYNILLWLYTGWADYNIGIAVIYLTLGIRVVLLPFSILSERGYSTRKALTDKLKEIRLDYANDPVKQKSAARLFLKKQKIRHWPKAVVLGVQVLVLLYKVFVTGISSAVQMEKLYSWVQRPDFVNPIFLGFDMTQYSLILPAMVAIYIFIEILFEHFISGEDDLGLYACREVILAIGRGFNPDIAKLLLKSDYCFEVIDLKDYAGKSRDTLLRIKGRVVHILR